MAVLRRGAVLFLLLAFTLAGTSTPALSVTKKQVESACADSRAALAEYRQAQGRFEEAAMAYEAAVNDVEQIELRQAHLRATVEHHEGSINDIKSRIEDRAVQLYMAGGSPSSGMMLFASSMDQLVTGTEFLSAAARDDLSSLDNLLSLRSELERLRGRLEETEVELRKVQEAREAWRNQQEQAMVAEQTAYRKLSSRCAQLAARYDAEQRRLAAIRAGRGGGAAGVPLAVTPGFICPINPSHTSFIDSWGFPRSGGRRHRGTDLLAPWGEAVLAVVSGTVYTGNGGLGGKSIWLIAADHDVAYYYAHLSGFAVSSGESVGRGEVIGYNGDSGNAEGGVPHLHFEIHPGGRGATAVNPYPTLRATCR